MSVPLGKVTETSDNTTMILKLQYPHTFLGLTFIIGRKIGFLFDNLKSYQFSKNTGVIDSKTMKEWVEKNGNQQLVNEMIYGAAQAYCMMEKKKENFTKEKLIKAITMTEYHITAKLLDELNKSTGKASKLQKN